jgi:ABC-type transport system involved in multi-copper enzyme maturation permease subunit
LKLLSIIQITFREALAKKIILAYLGISTFTCLLFLFAINLDIVDGMTSSIAIFGKEVSSSIQVDEIIEGVEGAISVLLFSIGLFMSCFATCSLIPSLLRPGFIDLFISKPISRLQILAGRYLGAVAVIAFNIFYLILFMWLILSIKTGVWNWGFIVSGLLITLTFSILYTMMMFIGVLTKSATLSLMFTYFIVFFSPLLLQRDRIYALLSSKIYGWMIDGLYYFFPKITELGNMTQQLTRGVGVQSWMPLWSSLMFAVFIFTLSSIIFQKKNF